MKTTDYIQRELPEIRELVMIEALHESRDRGEYVSPRDPAVQSRVAERILDGFGADLRRKVEQLAD